MEVAKWRVMGAYRPLWEELQCKEGGGIWLDEGEIGGEKKKRESKNKKINKERLVGFLEERGWCIYNRIIRGDEAEFTFTGGRGNSVIDYIMGNEEVKESVCSEWGKVRS